MKIVVSGFWLQSEVLSPETGQRGLKVTQDRGFINSEQELF